MRFAPDELSDELRIVRERSSPHYYLIARPTEDGKYKTVRQLPAAYPHNRRSAAGKAQQEMIKNFLWEGSGENMHAVLPDAPDIDATYGAWVAPEGIIERWDEAGRLGQIEKDMEKAKKEMQHDLRARERKNKVMKPIKSVDVGRVQQQGQNEGSVRKCLITVEHESGERYSFWARNVHDFGLVLNPGEGCSADSGMPIDVESHIENNPTTYNTEEEKSAFRENHPTDSGWGWEHTQWSDVSDPPETNWTPMRQDELEAYQAAQFHVPPELKGIRM